MIYSATWRIRIGKVAIFNSVFSWLQTVKIRFVIIFALVFAVACVSANQRQLDLMNSMIGRDRQVLINNFGPPHQVLRTSEGGQNWVYTRVVQETDPGYSVPPQRTPQGMNWKDQAAFQAAQGFAQGMYNRGPTTTVKHQHTIFTIDPQGVVTYWSRTALQ